MSNPGYFSRFTIGLFIYSLAIWLIGYSVFRLFIPDLTLVVFPFQVIYFYILTLVFHGYIVRASKRTLSKFTPRYLGATGIKMLVYMISVGIYIIIDSSEVIVFLVSFFILYLFFTVFEVRAVLKFLKKNQTNS
jgi:hypothetical protein